jgi:hypothetical protein
VLTGGSCLEDLETRRSDEAFLNALGAHRLLDPTTAGDFLRRFDGESVWRFRRRLAGRVREFGGRSLRRIVSWRSSTSTARSSRPPASARRGSTSPMTAGGATSRCW